MFFFQAEDGIRYLVRSRGLGDVYKRQLSDMPANLVRQPIYTVVQMNNVFNNPIEAGKDRWVAYPHPQVVVQYFNGFTGDLLYAEAIRIK
mgnify:CR=1 FL=1